MQKHKMVERNNLFYYRCLAMTKEKMYISCVFENVDDLFKYMNERKRFYTGNTRKIEIELIHSKEKSDE